MTVGYNYKDYNMSDDIIQKIEKYFSQIQRQEDTRGYVLRLISSFLDGRVKDQKFVLWTGTGCHAKDTEIVMFDKSIKKIQDIQLKDEVLGPDDRPRRVVALYDGENEMLTVNVNDENKTSFTTTPDHRLALRCHMKPEIAKTYDDIYGVDIYWVNYHMMTKDGPVKQEKKCYTEEESNAFIESLNDLEDFIEYGKIVPVYTMECMDMTNEVYKHYKLIHYSDHNNMDSDVTFTVSETDEDEYYGIELDGDKKYIMANGYITYNSNGKSTTISLIHDTFGDYSGTLPSQVVTRKRGGAGQATPDLADKAGKRFLVIQEPDPDDQIYVGQMKELSAGNDLVPARALYGAPFYFKPQFKMVLCCNKLPNIPANDGGTWRRLRVTPWETQFVDLCVQKLAEHQFYKDFKLEDQMKKWPQPFIWLLLNKYYPDYLENGLIEPEKVTKYTNKYKKDSDVYLEFLTEWTEEPTDENDDFEAINTLYRMFKFWYREAYSTSPPAQKEFISYLSDKFEVGRGKVKGLKLKIGDN